MTRPRVTNPARPADQYADKTRERIIEFYDPETDKGGLISFRRMECCATGGLGGHSSECKGAPRLRVDVYRQDDGVTVVVGQPEVRS